MAPNFGENGISECLLYTRVSTSNQVELGMSLDEQYNKLIAFTKSNGLTVCGIYTDSGISGAKKYTERPQLNNLITIIKKKQLLLVSSLDRLGRSVADILNICSLAKERGFFIYFMNLSLLYPSNIFSETMITMMSSIAQIERSLISERVKNTWNYRKENGLVNFKHWFVRELEDPLENYKRKQIIDHVKSLYTDGFSFKWIADYLNKLKFTTGHGKAFYPQSIKQMVDFFIECGDLKKRDIRDVIKSKK